MYHKARKNYTQLDKLAQSLRLLGSIKLYDEDKFLVV